MWPFSNFHENQAVQPVHDKLKATANICLGFCIVAMKSATEFGEIRNESMLITSLFTSPGNGLPPKNQYRFSQLVNSHG
jgi:hypothetical protein